MMRRHIAGWILLSMATAGHAVAQRSAAAQLPAAQTESSKSREEVRKLEANILSTMTMTRSDSENQSETIPLLDHSLLRYEDPTRANEFGAIWIWTTGGRPVAVLDSYWSPAGLWCMVVNQLDGATIRVRRQDRPWWTPEKSGVVWHEVASENVATTGRIRSLQMKNIARKFTAHEFWDPNNSRFELRLLSQPLHRYQDLPRGIQDGALFAFANGTNPEVFLMLEARAEGQKLKWFAGLARLGHAEMHVDFDKRSLWTVPRVNPDSPKENYWLTFIQSPQ